jgi:hypothetical protein
MYIYKQWIYEQLVVGPLLYDHSLKNKKVAW